MNATIGRVLQIFAGMNANSNITAFEPLKNLISIDTLKAMQLIGFNYKEAIGEPLTHACANAIKNKLAPKNNFNERRKC